MRAVTAGVDKNVANGAIVARRRDVGETNSSDDSSVDMYVAVVPRRRSRGDSNARVFTDILKTQLVLKEITTGEEFDLIKDFLQYDFATDNHFTELKDAEIMRERIDTLSQVSDYVGQYYSKEYVRKYILMQTEEDIKKIDKQISKEGEGESDEKGEDDFGGF